ncbi:MAG TPA: heme ABC exporter ATP-binding protein CcmA [Bacillota bacterium]|nr:heme ABC exporter ATP-binding protein CcmA [Bacillota bacterium]
MILQVEQLSKSYNRRIIFEGISFTMEPGDRLVVTGPNGSGKSTLLKIICGLLQPSSGTVHLSNGSKKMDLAERKQCCGYASPEVNLYDRLTAYENLSFFAALRGLPPCRERMVELLKRLQLKEYMHQPLCSYSSGMKQRVKLACALLHEPCLLLLDEPSCNLDEQGRRALEELLNLRPLHGITIIATNETEEVEKFGQKLLSLGVPPGGAA